MFSKNYKKKAEIFISTLFIFLILFSPIFSVRTAFADENECVPTNTEIVSDTTNQIVGGDGAVATYSQNPRWTASIPGAIWIWKTFLVPDSTQDETQIFTKTFNIASTSTLDSASLIVATDNSYTVSINGTQIGADATELNYLDENKDTFDVVSYLHGGSNIISFNVKNWGIASSTPQGNPAGLLYKLSIRMHDTNCNSTPPTNTPPTITLTGANPLNLTVGTLFIDPGATATDTQDGNLTSQIVRTGTVNASTTGSYTLTYVVKDSGNLYATTTRVVNVNPAVCTSNCGGESHTPTVSLVSNPNTITVGATSTLTWSSTNTNSCSANWTTSTSTSGFKILSPTTTTSYSITCVGAEGSKTATATISVNPLIISTTTPPVIPPATTTPPINSPVNPPTNNGGGGGGIGGHRHPVVVGEILGATSCLYLRDYLKIDRVNDPIEVLKLQSFLNVYEKENLSYTGIFDQTTFEAVQRFQMKYSKDILEPWGEKVTTGFVYILTKKKINEIYCNTVIDLSQEEKNEIESFKNFIEDNPNIEVSNQVGSLPSPEVVSISDNVLKESPVVELKDNSLNQSVIRNAAVSLFALPQKIFGSLFSDCSYASILLFLILIALIIIIIKLFTNSKDNSQNIPVATSIIEAPIKEESPVIILPGAIEKDEKMETPEILPDEEIVIENPEEGPEEIIEEKIS